MAKQCVDCAHVTSRLRQGRCGACHEQLIHRLKQEGTYQPPSATTPAERALSRSTPGPGGCLIFTGHLDKDGYGRASYDGPGARMAHRVVYEGIVGPIPEGMELDHLCRVRACVNPDHLEVVTRRENSLRSESFAAENARKTHCIHGHEFSPENTYVKPNGHRQCRTCGREATARYFATTGRARDRRRRAK